MRSKDPAESGDLFLSTYQLFNSKVPLWRWELSNSRADASGTPWKGWISTPTASKFLMRTSAPLLHILLGNVIVCFPWKARTTSYVTVLAPTEVQAFYIAGLRYIFNMWLGSFLLMISQSLMAQALALRLKAVRWILPGMYRTVFRPVPEKNFESTPSTKGSLSVVLLDRRVDSTDCHDFNCRMVWDVGLYLPRNMCEAEGVLISQWYAQLCPNWWPHDKKEWVILGMDHIYGLAMLIGYCKWPIFWIDWPFSAMSLLRGAREAIALRGEKQRVNVHEEMGEAPGWKFRPWIAAIANTFRGITLWGLCRTRNIINQKSIGILSKIIGMSLQGHAFGTTILTPRGVSAL